MSDASGDDHDEVERRSGSPDAGRAQVEPTSIQISWIGPEENTPGTIPGGALEVPTKGPQEYVGHSWLTRTPLSPEWLPQEEQPDEPEEEVFGPLDALIHYRVVLPGLPHLLRQCRFGHRPPR